VADLTLTLTGDEARAIRAIQKVIDKQGELARKAGEAGMATKRGAEEASTAYESLSDGVSGAISDLNRWSTATNVLRDSWGGVLNVMQAVMNRQREAQQFASKSAGGLEALGQLAGGDSAKLAKLMRHVRRIYPIVGGSDMNEAAKLVNDVVAAGFEDSETINAAARLHHTLGGDAGKAATGIAGIQKSMGIGETGDFNLVMAKAVEAARTAPGGVPDVLKYASKSGGIARAVGMRDEELFAAFAQVAAAAGNPEMGGSQLSALITKMGAMGGQGSLMDFVDRIATEGVTVTEGRGKKKKTRQSREVEDIIKALGSDEAFRAYSALSLGSADVRAGTRAMEGVRPVDLAAAGDSDPAIRVERQRRAAEARRYLADEGVGRYHQSIDTVIEQDLLEMQRLGFSEFHRGIVDQGIDGPFGLGVPSARTLLKQVVPMIPTWLPGIGGLNAELEKEVERRTGIRPDGSLARPVDPQMDEQTRVLRDIERNSRGVQLVQPPGSGGRDAR
jgi:hypothetical protein